MAQRKVTARAQWLPVAAGTLCTAALTLLLALGLKRADELQSASAALQLASELSTRPDYIHSELTLVQRGLETQTWIGEPVRAVEQSARISAAALRDLQFNVRAAGLEDEPRIMQPLRTAIKGWTPLAQKLPRVTGATLTGLYADSSTGSQLSATGRELKANVDELLQHEAAGIDAVGSAFGQVAAELRRTVAESGRSQRTLMLTGTALAAVLLALMLYFAVRARRSAATAASAQRQIDDIFSTVREGLFLVDRNLRIGAAHSDSLQSLLRAPAPAGALLEELLRPLVDDKTLQAATRFLGLLWKDKINDELIDSVNPLSQVEAHFARPQGGRDTRYLSFSFRRVRSKDGEHGSERVLGTVADVTDRVLLAQELEQVRAEHESQAATLLQVMKIDPPQLETFLNTLDTACRKANAMLTAPGMTREDLRRKLNGVFRELHALKGESTALGLGTVGSRIHALEDILTALRARQQLAGNDFVPVVVRLDELLNHAGMITQMQQRFAAMRPALAELQVPPPDAATPAGGADGAGAPRPPERPPGLEPLLRQTVREVAGAVGREVRLQTDGLTKVPSAYAAVVKDICIQMIRNSICHGIEPPEERAVAGKPRSGTARVVFIDQGVDDYGLTVEDDGRGLDYEQILDRALRDGLLKPEQAMQLDRASIFRLIFHPGFTTATTVSEHAGRGVGLDAVTAMIRERGGRIGVSTAPGQYTRFKILLPKKSAPHGPAPGTA
ncbi:MAG: Hpt domain-containing protein [Gammaproteobacteria bacterium]|nr:Hpt domain-containing protein [Gammaproteobacteria bacterium]